MSTLIQNSSQPYLYKDNNNLSQMLYCYADHSIDLSYGSSSYKIRPWKIKKLNLDTQESSVIQTVSYHQDYGLAILECNPHLYIKDGIIKLYYTAGFMKEEGNPITYHLCSMTADNLNLDHLVDLSIIEKTFSGTMINDNELLCVQKAYGKDILVKKDINSNNGRIISLDYLQIDEILRLTKRFDNDKVIITGKTYQKNYVSYLLNNNLIIEDSSIIQNSYNMDVYKCSLLDNIMAYTVRNESYGPEDVESRSIVIENNIA